MFTVIVFLIFFILFVWVLATFLHNPSLIDMFWPLGLLFSGLIYLWPAHHERRIFIILLLLTIWALRLSGYLFFTRIIKNKVDKRYLRLSGTWKNAQYFFNFIIQGIFIFIVSLPFFFAATLPRTSMMVVDALAILLCVVGIVGESLADWQLQQCKKQTKKNVCDHGLWNYSRHPNYFFDWLTWLGFSLFGLSTQYGFLSLVSPIMLYFIMSKMTMPLTERLSIESKGEAYRQYQAQVSAFFPWFKRRSR